MPDPTVCKFCSGPDPEGTNACLACAKKYLRCQPCGYANDEFRGQALNTLLATGRWQGMPANCLACGTTAINPKVKAIGLGQVNYTKLDGNSYIRRRLCPKS